MERLHIDIETFSGVNLLTSGVYKYAASPDFEILLFAYCFNSGEVKIVDLARGEKLPGAVVAALKNKNVEKWAYNAAFERVCLRAAGFEVPAEQWRCTMVTAAFFGFPFGLAACGMALGLSADKQKDPGGGRLISYFCCPLRSEKTGEKPALFHYESRTRNRAEDDLEKWQQFKNYCIQDVITETAIYNKIAYLMFPKSELKTYVLDQKINDRGVLVDIKLAEGAIKVDKESRIDIISKLECITGLKNVNSPVQLVDWINANSEETINSLTKESVINLLPTVTGDVKKVLELRLRLAKTSIRKYIAMLNYRENDNYVRGLFQYYGANRTGRFAGRGVQLHNLPRMYLKYLDAIRGVIKRGDYALTALLYDNIPDTLSQLIRTAFICEAETTLAVVDFAAIEARVIAWLAGEQWRLKVFATHGKIYEASAAAMFNVPIEKVDKQLRQQGKVAELALGFQGAVGALCKMGADRFLSKPEMQKIVKLWRKTNPAIVALWAEVESCVISAISLCAKTELKSKLVSFYCDDKHLIITLPSGRELYYVQPQIIHEIIKYNIYYKGLDDKKKWGLIDTYGGKLVENIVQAIARDALVAAMHRLDENGFDIALHVHDEIAAQIPIKNAETRLEKMIKLMSAPLPWAPGLILTAEGYLTSFYKKD